MHPECPTSPFQSRPRPLPCLPHLLSYPPTPICIDHHSPSSYYYPLHRTSDSPHRFKFLRLYYQAHVQTSCSLCRELSTFREAVNPSPFISVISISSAKNHSTRFPKGPLSAVLAPVTSLRHVKGQRPCAFTKVPEREEISFPSLDVSQFAQVLIKTNLTSFLPLFPEMRR